MVYVVSSRLVRICVYVHVCGGVGGREVKM